MYAAVPMTNAIREKDAETITELWYGWKYFVSCGIHLRAIISKMLKISIPDISLKTTNLRLQLDSPGANAISIHIRASIH